jgi:hypothetical protein
MPNLQAIVDSKTQQDSLATFLKLFPRIALNEDRQFSV